MLRSVISYKYIYSAVFTFLHYFHLVSGEKEVETWKMSTESAFQRIALYALIIHIIVHKCTEIILVSTVTCFDMFLVPWKNFLNVPFALSKQ